MKLPFMKTFTVLIVILIGGLLAAAALSAPASTDGKGPPVMAAAAAASVLVLVYFTTYGWLRKDPYVLGALMFLALEAGIKLVRLLVAANSFGFVWGVAIVLGGAALPLAIFGALRIAYVGLSTRTDPFDRPAKKADSDS